MTQNWICTKCKAYNPPKRQVCWQCGNSRLEQSTGQREASVATQALTNKSVGVQQLISEAWQITWQNKHLWLLGFVAGLIFRGGYFNVGLAQGGAWLFQNFDSILNVQGITALLYAGISIVLWPLRLAARIGLIYDVSIGTPPQKLLPKIVALFRTSTRPLGMIILMQLLIWSPIVLLNTGLFFWAGPPTESPVSFGALWLLNLGIILLAIPLLFIDAFTYRSIVLENLGVIGGIKQACHVIRTNLSTILRLAILCTFIGIIFSFAGNLLASVLVLPLSLVIWPLVRSVLECSSGGDYNTMMNCMQNASAHPLFIGISLFSSLVFAAVSSVWVALQSSAFTLVYMNRVKNE